MLFALWLIIVSLVFLYLSKYYSQASSHHITVILTMVKITQNNVTAQNVSLRY